MNYKYPLCRFGTVVTRAVDGGGWFWERCWKHEETADAVKMFRERQREWYEQYRKEHPHVS